MKEIKIRTPQDIIDNRANYIQEVANDIRDENIVIHEQQTNNTHTDTDIGNENDVHQFDYDNDNEINNA